MSWMFGLFLAGCSGAGGSDSVATSTRPTTTSTPTTSTDVGYGSCPVPYAPVPQSVCLSSANLDASEPALEVRVVQATVVGPPGPGTGNVAEASGFPRCFLSDIPPEQQLELLADDGAAWVVGFDSEVSAAAIRGTLAGLAPGTNVVLHYRHVQSWPNGIEAGVAVHDADGPVVVWEQGHFPNDSLGFEVVPSDGRCTVGTRPYTTTIHEQGFSSDVGSALTLWPGERGLLQLAGGRTLELEAADHAWQDDCFDGCGFNGFAAWAVVP